MMSSADERLKSAGEAWRRLFQNAKPINKNINKQQTTLSQPHNTLKLTMENLRQNQPWGDILKAKAEGHIRIYSQNVNGLQYQKDGGQYLEMCQIIKEIQADVYILNLTFLSIIYFRDWGI
jgi:hypothetical protein